MANTKSIHDTGKDFVEKELERRGFIVCTPITKEKNFDFLVFNKETYKQYAVIVKTSINGKAWRLHSKHEKIDANNIIYIFVCLNNYSFPTYHIIKALEVSKTIKEYHKIYLNSPKKNGNPHKDTDIREFFDIEDIYKDNWNIIC